MPAGAPLRHRHSRAGGNPVVPAQAGIQIPPLLRRYLQKRGRDRSAVKLVSPRLGRLPRLLHRVSGRRLPEEAAAPPPAPSFHPYLRHSRGGGNLTPAGPVARAASPCIREASAERGRGPTPSSVIPPLAPSFPRRRESNPGGAGCQERLIVVRIYTPCRVSNARRPSQDPKETVRGSLWRPRRRRVSRRAREPIPRYAVTPNARPPRGWLREPWSKVREVGRGSPPRLP